MLLINRMRFIKSIHKLRNCESNFKSRKLKEFHFFNFLLLNDDNILKSLSTAA